MNKKQLNTKIKQLQNELSTSIQKMEQLDTNEVAFKELTKIFGEYQNEDFIKVIVQRIQQTFRSKYSTNLLRENVIIMIGMFFSSYKEKSQPFVSALLRMITKHFDIERQSLQQSCARSIKELYQHVILKVQKKAKVTLLISPLLDLLITSQSISQSSCCLCLYELLLYTVHEKLFEDFHLIADKILKVITVYI